MLVATFNATTGWAGRQISWQDERFILDGHGVITAADVVTYDRQGQLDWPSEEMHSWVAARLSWEQAVAPAVAQPVVSQPVQSQPVVEQEPAAVQPVAEQPAALEALDATPAEPQPSAPAQAEFGGTAAGTSEPPEVEPEAEADEPIVTPMTGEELAGTEGTAAVPEQGPVEPELVASETEAEPAAVEAESAAAETEPVAAVAAAQVAASEPAAQIAAQPIEEVRDVLAPGGDIQEVVGSAAFQEALTSIAGAKPGAATDVEKWAHLIPEPDNPWDRNAVAVYIDGRKVGYLPRETSPAYAAILGRLWTSSRGRAVCRGVISGGWRQVQSQVGSVTTAEDDQFGVRLALASPQHFEAVHELRQLTAEELASGPAPV